MLDSPFKLVLSFLTLMKESHPSPRFPKPSPTLSVLARMVNAVTQNSLSYQQALLFSVPMFYPLPHSTPQYPFPDMSSSFLLVPISQVLHAF
jgi:hypothetical protein